jgi:transposase
MPQTPFRTLQVTNRLISKICVGLVLIWKQLQQGSFRWPPIMDGVMKLSPVEFAALFDGLDWTRVQAIRGIPKPTVAV